MDLMKLGTSLLASKLGAGGGSNDAISSVLGGLLGGGDSKSGGGMGSIISAMQGKGLGSIAESWLSDGDNADISTDQVKEVIGSDKIAEMASQLNTDEGSLLDGLKDALPQLVDKSSSGGSFLDNLGGIGGALNMAKKFL
ncbi:MAG: YidB family protein [Gammaproteobacteria bacterium]